MILILATLLVAPLTGAADTTSMKLTPTIQGGDVNQPEGLWPFLGAGLGITDNNGEMRTGGIPSHLKLLGSYYFKESPVITDVGLGVHNEVLTQRGSGSNTIQSFYTELSARYQLSNHWQLGAIWNTLVDTPDRYHSNTNNLASFLGLQALKEFSWDNQYVVRAGGRAMTDVGISGESVNTVMAELQVSFGGGKKLSPVALESASIKEEPIEVTPAPLAPHLADAAMRSFQIHPGPVNFESGSVRLVQSSKGYLKRLARALAANRHLFDRIEVVGHTDQRGPNPYNDQLSVKRAVAVTSTLVSSGLNPNQIEVQGKGKRALITHSMDGNSLQRNRRVEIAFLGVKNQSALKNVIDSVSR